MVLDTNIVEDFKSSTTIHGLSRAGGPEIYYRRRLVWIVLVFAAAGGLLTFLIFEFVHLSNHPTNTIFSTKLRHELKFPAITVCNLNQVKKTIINCLSENEKTEIEEVFFMLSELSVILERDGINKVAHRTSISGEKLHACAMNNSHRLDDMLRYCHYKDQYVNCSDIFSPKMTEYGQCYTFNGAGEKVTNAVGENSGVRFFVNIQQDEYFYSSTIRSGIKVVLHDPSEEPLPSFRGFLVGPGLSAGCSIKKSTVVTLPEPYGSCRDVSQDTTSLTTYSDMTCFKQCYDDYLSRKCGCMHLFLNGSLPYCDSTQLRECYALYQRNISRDKEVMKGCSCPPNCKTKKFDAIVSYAAFSSRFIADLLYNRSILPDANYIDRNFIDIRLYYNTLIEEEITEVPEKSVGSILGTVGGQMGMFIGASILSIVELVEFVFLLLTKGTKRWAQRTTRKPCPDVCVNTAFDDDLERSNTTTM